MCEECGCSDHNTKTIEVGQKILDANDRQAAANRKHFDEHNVFSLNLMSSPGSGKTRLLEETIVRFGNKYKLGVVEGDLETNLDAERIRKKGVPAHQITTGQACHLDAKMVHEGIHKLPLPELDFLFVENVGNLVCPASYDLGTHLRVVLLSVPEGDDKPAKYPVMFRRADLMLITKTDLLPHFDFRLEAAIGAASKINPNIKTISLSAKTGEGIDEWIKFLTSRKAT